MKISQTVYNLQSGHEYMVEMAMFNVQKEITPKVGRTELQFRAEFRTLSYTALHCEVWWL